MLLSNGFIVGVDCVVSNNNLKCIPEFVKWLEKEKVHGLTLIKIKKGDLPLGGFRKQLPGYLEYSKLIEELCDRVNEMPNVTIDCGSVSNLEYTLKDNELDIVPVAGCPVGHTLLSIAPNGDIYPCVALNQAEFKLGNALKDDLEKIWNNSEVLKELRSVKSKIHGKCKGCDRLDHCRGGCRGIAYSLYNHLWESDKTCGR